MHEARMRRIAKPLLFLAAFIWGTSLFHYEEHAGRGAPLLAAGLSLCHRSGAFGAVLRQEAARPVHLGTIYGGAVSSGTFLFIAYSTQTFGLTGTTPSKNAFLTATYCVLVPFLTWAVFHRRPDRYNLLAAGLCVAGVGLLSLSGDLTVTWGDGLSLFSALFYGLHIVAVNRLSPDKDIYLLTAVAVCLHRHPGPGGGPAVPALPRRDLPPAGGAAPPGLSVRHGHHRGPPVPERGAGVVRACLRLGDPLLESVFGVLFSVLFYGDPVTPRLLLASP